ncbi:MAG: ABC transporter permease, partial [Pseudomonadota bacterium]
MEFLTNLAWFAGALAACAVIAWVFRLPFRFVGADWARPFAQMPLTASFGILVVALYAIVAIFAPIIAPFGEREIVDAEYLPWDNTY